MHVMDDPLCRPLCCPIAYNRTIYTPTDYTTDVEATVPPSFNPVQVATELGSSASNVYSWGGDDQRLIPGEQR